MTKEEKEVYTLGNLKQFLSELTEEQLQQPVRVWGEESGDLIAGADIIDEPIYRSKYDDENRGTLAELKELEGEDFNEDDFEMCVPVGTVALLIDF